jgi:hypothetical protein
MPKRAILPISVGMPREPAIFGLGEHARGTRQLPISEHATRIIVPKRAWQFKGSQQSRHAERAILQSSLVLKLAAAHNAEKNNSFNLAKRASNLRPFCLAVESRARRACSRHDDNRARKRRQHKRVMQHEMAGAAVRFSFQDTQQWC